MILIKQTDIWATSYMTSNPSILNSLTSFIKFIQVPNGTSMPIIELEISHCQAHSPYFIFYLHQISLIIFCQLVKLQKIIVL